jgi:aminoglycoside phosphotransferase (APT) family kinase protein
VPTDADPSSILLRAFPGCRVAACQALAGGVSARAVVADVVLADATPRRVVVRRPSFATREETLNAVSREHELLARLAACGIPAPRPCFLDLEAAALVLEYVDGVPEFAPADTAAMLQQMASHLAHIHQAPIAQDLPFLPRRDDTAGRHVLQLPERLDASLDEARLRAVLRELWPWPRSNPDVLLHGDFWPGNLLWREGALVAVLDWEEAEIGDPLADVALTRLDLLWASGEEAMEVFTKRYREQTRIDWRNLARWDLCVALRPMSNLARWARVHAEPPISRPDVTEASMREGHRRFVRQALRSLEIIAAEEGSRDTGARAKSRSRSASTSRANGRPTASRSGPRLWARIAARSGAFPSMPTASTSSTSCARSSRHRT